MLQVIDQHWREHLSALDHLRQGIHLRGYAQKNPKQEYKREAFELFALMQGRIRNDVTRILMTVRVETASEAQSAEARIAGQSGISDIQYGHADFNEAASSAAGADAESIALALQQAPEARDAGAQPFKRFGPKVGRNDPCPCGSGRKFKACHGRLA
jgi:preprotein translocase subunit SecA